MELKSYQQEVINDLSGFIEQLEKTEQLNVAFSRFWESKGISLQVCTFLKDFLNNTSSFENANQKMFDAFGINIFF